MSEIKANNADSELLFISKNTYYYLHESHCLLITECRIKGQIYYPKCAPCDTLCERPNRTYNPIVCPAVCKPGCACPVGQLIKYGLMCVKPKDCVEKGDFKCDSLPLCMCVYMCMQV